MGDLRRLARLQRALGMRLELQELRLAAAHRDRQQVQRAAEATEAAIASPLLTSLGLSQQAIRRLELLRQREAEANSKVEDITREAVDAKGRLRRTAARFSAESSAEQRKAAVEEMLEALVLRDG